MTEGQRKVKIFIIKNNSRVEITRLQVVNDKKKILQLSRRLHITEGTD